MKTKRNAYLTIERRNSLAGWAFISPFVIGVVLFFAYPLVESIRYSLSTITPHKASIDIVYVGIKNYSDLLFKNPEYLTNLGNYFLSMLYEVPAILLFSLFIALMLTQKFRGRLLARAVFFLPVIISSGIVISIIGNDLTSATMRQQSTLFITNNRVLTDLLLEARVAGSWIQALLDAVSRIFDLTWKSGVQILLFLASLSAIPSSFYEASSIEGASGWVTFWKITFPMITPFVLVSFVLTIIESFTDYNNPLINYIYSKITNLEYGLGSAMSWVYTLLVFIVITTVTAILSRNVFYQAD